MSGPETLPAVIKYIEAWAKVAVRLPAARPVCKYCVAWLKYERDYDRYTCRLTEEPLFEINKGVGLACPLRAKEDLL